MFSPQNTVEKIKKIFCSFTQSIFRRDQVKEKIDMYFFHANFLGRDYNTKRIHVVFWARDSNFKKITHVFWIKKFFKTLFSRPGFGKRKSKTFLFFYLHDLFWGRKKLKKLFSQPFLGERK